MMWVASLHTCLESRRIFCLIDFYFFLKCFLVHLLWRLGLLCLSLLRSAFDNRAAAALYLYILHSIVCILCVHTLLENRQKWLDLSSIYWVYMNHWMQCAKLQSIKNLFSHLKYVSMYIWQSYSNISESCTKFPLQLNFI